MTANRSHDEYADAVGAILEQVEPQLAAYLERASESADKLPAETLAQRMIDALPKRSLIDVQAGPFYRQADVQKILGGVSRQAVHERVKRDRILSMVTVDGTRVFPTFQFENGKVHPYIADAIEILFSGIDDGWTIALWLTSEHDGATAASILQSGEASEIERVLAAAREDAARWVV